VTTRPKDLQDGDKLSIKFENNISTAAIKYRIGGLIHANDTQILFLGALFVESLHGLKLFACHSKLAQNLISKDKEFENKKPRMKEQLQLKSRTLLCKSVEMERAAENF
jgi:hypothetical protein